MLVSNTTKPFNLLLQLNYFQVYTYTLYTLFFNYLVQIYFVIFGD